MARDGIFHAFAAMFPINCHHLHSGFFIESTITNALTFTPMKVHVIHTLKGLRRLRNLSKDKLYVLLPDSNLVPMSSKAASQLLYQVVPL